MVDTQPVCCAVQVQQHIRRVNKQTRQLSHVASRVQDIEAQGGSVPDLDATVLLKPREVRPPKVRMPAAAGCTPVLGMQPNQLPPSCRQPT